MWRRYSIQSGWMILCVLFCHIAGLRFRIVRGELESLSSVLRLSKKWSILGDRSMFESPTWDAILQQWPWFAAAAAVFVGAVGLLIAIKPRTKG
jgi:hypothetical protein